MAIATDFSDAAIARKCGRIERLVDLNRDQAPNRTKTKDIMNGGRGAVARLIGRDLTDEKAADLIPFANLMLKANDRLGQKIGRKPDVRVHPPQETERERAYDYAEKRARVIEAYDELSGVDIQLPQAGRWLPGYGFFSWSIKQGFDPLTGDPYPHATLRDPFNSYPGQWGLEQQPRDIAYRHVIDPEDLEALFPGTMGKLGEYGASRAYDSTGYLPRERGGVLLGEGTLGSANWQNQSGKGIVVWEYLDEFGTWWLIPDKKHLLTYVPNPLSSPAFVVVKRYSFDQLQGQYDQMIGLMAAQARLLVLMIAAGELSVNAETNIEGEVLGKYVRGKGAINYLAPGSKVIKQNDRIPFEVFQQINTVERLARSMATYPVTDDAVSPNSFVTGLGLEELKGSLGDEVAEYHLVTGRGLQLLDAKRLEWCDKVYPDRTLHIYGSRSGADFSETYTPRTHIKGAYRTRRIYGMMAGWDEPNKIIGGATLNQLKIVDRDTFRENLDGLDNPQLVKERLRNEQIEELLFSWMTAQLQSQDPAMSQKAIQVLVEILPDGKDKELLEEVFLSEEEQPQPQPVAPAGPVPDAATVLNRLTTNGAVAGVQSVTRG